MIPRNEKSEEAPVLPPVKPRQREKRRDRLYHCKHNGEGWKWAAKKKNHIAGEDTASHSCWRACQTGLRPDKGLSGQGLDCTGTGPRAPRIEDQPNKACLFPFVRDEMIGVLWQAKQLQKQECLLSCGHMEGASDSVVVWRWLCGLCQKELSGLDGCCCSQVNSYSFIYF